MESRLRREFVVEQTTGLPPTPKSVWLDPRRTPPAPPNERVGLAPFFVPNPFQKRVLNFRSTRIDTQRLAGYVSAFHKGSFMERF
jgi:hypothetical protein